MSEIWISESFLQQSPALVKSLWRSCADVCVLEGDSENFNYTGFSISKRDADDFCLLFELFVA